MAQAIQRPDADIFHNAKPLQSDRERFAAYLQDAGKAAPVKDRMEVTLQLATCLILTGVTSNMKTVEMLLQECEEYMMANGRDEEKACIYLIRATFLFQSARYAEGLEACTRANFLFRQQVLLFFTMHTAILCGTLCMLLDLEAEGLDYLDQAYKLAEGMEDEKDIVTYLSAINDTLMHHLPAEDAIQRDIDLQARVRIAYENKPNASDVAIHQRLAHLYVKAGNLDIAMHHAEKGIKLLADFPGIPNYDIRFCNLYMLKIKVAGLRHDEAAMLQNSDKVKALLSQTQAIYGSIQVLSVHFKYYLDIGNLLQAKHCMNEIGAIIPESDRGLMYFGYQENLCLYYHATGDTASELDCYKQVHEHKMKAHKEAGSNRSKYMSTVYELEQKKKEVTQQKAEIDFKTQELNMTTYHLNQRNNLLNDLKKNIDDLKKAKSKADVVFTTITKRIDQAFVKEEEEKIRFREKFDETHRGFISRLHLTYPGLSPTECRICALLRSGFNTKEIANLLSTSSRNIENHRVRIRAKMNLMREDNLNLVLTEIK